MKNAVVSLFATLAVASYFPLFLYFRNAGEAHLRDIVFALLVFILTDAVVFLLSLIAIRSAFRAGVFTVLWMLVFQNYARLETTIQSFLPSLRYWHIAPILLIVLLHLGWLIRKKLPENLCRVIVPVLGAVFLGLSLINAVAAVPAISIRLNAEKKAELAAQSDEADASLPNFYFILFDEFSTIPFMQKHYGYDNTQLLDRLSALGFHISQTGHNEINVTAYVTANLFQMDYIAEWGKTPDAECFALRSDNRVFPMLREAGYRIVSPAGASFYGLPDALEGAAASEAKTVSGETLRTILLNATMAYPFLDAPDNYLFDDARTTVAQLDYMKDMTHFSGRGQFTLAHFILPHAPFYFEADGKMSTHPSDNWKNPEPYLNQYRFASSQMMEIAELLVAQDPDAIIWLLSDHSARASNDEELYLKKFPMEDMTNFFSAVYYRGEAIEIDGLSGVNTMRLLMNRLIGTSFEMVPLPSAR